MNRAVSRRPALYLVSKKLTLAEAFLLGGVQGLTEFIPVSSSAHLIFFQHWLGLKGHLFFFDIVLHLGTLVSLLIYFARDLLLILRDSLYAFFFLLRRKSWREVLELAPHARWALGIAIAAFPTAFMGLLLKEWVEGLFASLTASGFSLWVTSALLALSAYFQEGEKGIEKMRILDFFLIGVVQGIAVIPGISRAGLTIAVGLFLGLNRETAFRFSFLAALPAILGVGILEGLEGGRAHHGFPLPTLGVGFLTAAFIGYFALHLASLIIRKRKLPWIALYTFAFSLVILASRGRLE